MSDTNPLYPNSDCQDIVITHDVLYLNNIQNVMAITTLNVNDPKDTVFQLRINKEVKSAAEELFRQCGMTLSDAINIFIQQSLNRGALPFVVSSESRMSKDEATRILFEKYLESRATYAKADDLPPVSTLWKELGIDQ